MIQYILSNGSEQLDVTELARSKLKAQFKRESNQKFKRLKLTGSLVLTGDLYRFAYDTLTACCGQLRLTIYNNGNLVGTAKIQPFGPDYDNSTCRVEVNTFTIEDQYTPVLANWEKEVNVLYYADFVTFTCPKVPADVASQDRGRSFIGLFNYLLAITMQNAPGNVIRPTLDGYSEFYQADKNPVRGIANPLKQLTFVHLSDVVAPNATQPAQVGTMTLKAFLEQIRIMHKVFWDIDQYGYLRLEHEQFYDLGYTYQVPALTAVPDLRNAGTSTKFRYEETNLFSVEGLESSLHESLQQDRKHTPGVSDQGWPDWLSGIVRYENCIPLNDSGDERKNVLQMAWLTDYTLAVIDKGEKIGRQGWALVELDGATVRQAVGARSGATLVNGDQSPANLFIHYHRWGRSYPTGIFNEASAGFGGNAMAMRFVTPNQVWSAFTLPACEVVDPQLNAPVRVAMTDQLAFVDTVDWDFSRETLQITVKTGGLCYQDPSNWPDVEVINPTCPPLGELLSTTERIEFERGGFFGIFRSPRPIRVITETFANGNCGTYERVTRKPLLT